MDRYVDIAYIEKISSLRWTLIKLHRLLIIILLPFHLACLKQRRNDEEDRFKRNFRVLMKKLTNVVCGGEKRKKNKEKKKKNRSSLLHCIHANANRRCMRKDKVNELVRRSCWSVQPSNIVLSLLDSHLYFLQTVLCNTYSFYPPLDDAFKLHNRN